MTCRQIENELSAYLDGEASDAVRAGVQAHLGTCERCRQRLAQLQRLSEGVARLPQLEPPPRFVPDLFRRIRGGKERNVSWVDVVFRPVWLKVPVEAVAVLVVAVGVMFLSQRQDSRQQQCVVYTPTVESPTAPAPTPSAARKDLDELARKPSEPSAGAPALSPMPTVPRRALAFKQAAEKALGTESSVVVANANPSVVEQRVTALVKEMEGAVVEVKRDHGVARSIRVRVPTAMVAEFKAQLAEAKGERQMRRMTAFAAADSAVREEKKTEAEVAKAKETPMTELEIRIVAPAKK